MSGTCQWARATHSTCALVCFVILILFFLSLIILWKYSSFFLFPLHPSDDSGKCLLTSPSAVRAGSPRANSSSTTNQRQLWRIWTPYYGGNWGVVITSSQPSWQEIEEIIAAIVIISYGGTVLVERSSPSNSGPEIDRILNQSNQSTTCQLRRI